MDLMKTKVPVTPVNIHRVSVNMEEECKYIGVYMEKKLDWSKDVV